MIMTHTAQLFEVLTESGIKPESARRIEREVQASIEQGIDRYRIDDRTHGMTKADGVALEQKLHHQITDLELNLRLEMTEMKSDLCSEMAEIKIELRHEMSQFEGRLMAYISDHGWKMMGFQVALIGIFFSIYRFLN
jgi:hypothetical protein